jgi:hypothetical protein
MIRTGNSALESVGGVWDFELAMIDSKGQSLKIYFKRLKTTKPLIKGALLFSK